MPPRVPVADAGERAADAFYKANDYRRAAELYRRHDRLREAGDSYERIGDLAQATEFYDKFFTRQLDIARGDLSQVQPAVQVAERAAELLLELDKKSEAADLLLRAGSRRRAAELFASVGEIERAADIYFEAKRRCSRHSSTSPSATAMACLSRRSPPAQRREGLAADDWRLLKHIYADLYNEVGQPSRAAEFEAAGDLRMAAEAHGSADMHRKAAEAYERVGDHAAAIELYRAMGDHKAELQAAKSGNNYFRVGEILRHGRKEDALAAFQRVETIDASSSACIVQGDILRELQRLDIAFNKYKSALGNAAPSKANVDILYKMARTADDANVPQQALRLYESVIGIDYYYQDASEQATNIRKKLDKAGARQQALGANEGGGVVASPVPLRQPSGQHSLVPEASGPSRYEILEEVARGGMGIVYKARDTVLDRVVAYKILSSNLKTNKVAVKYFLREAQAAAKMSHPNIVTVFDAGEQDGEYYMAMEFVEGQALKQLVNRQGAFPEKLVRYIFVHVCRGLTYAHERGLCTAT